MAEDIAYKPISEDIYTNYIQNKFYFNLNDYLALLGNKIFKHSVANNNSVTLYTTPQGKVFFLSYAYLSCLSTAAGIDHAYILVSGDGTNYPILEFYLAIPAGNFDNFSQNCNLNPCFVLKEGEEIQVYSSDALAYSSGTIFGYELTTEEYEKLKNLPNIL